MQNLILVSVCIFLSVSCGLLTPSDETSVTLGMVTSGNTEFDGTDNSSSGGNGDNSDNPGQIKTQDSDLDGLTDQQEIKLGTDPLVADTDGDQLSDGDEVSVHATDPLKIDTDDDSHSDYDELFVLPDMYPNLPIDPLNPDNDGDLFHPLADQKDWPQPADCDNLNASVFPGATESFLDDNNSGCSIDVPTLHLNFPKGYHVQADIIPVSYDLFNVKVYAFHDTAPNELWGECQVKPDELDANSGCLAYCNPADYSSQYDANFNLIGYSDDYACDSWVNPPPISTDTSIDFGVKGFRIERLSPVRFRIYARSKLNNHKTPYYGLYSGELGD